MAIVYTCDSCGKVIKDPYSQVMKEFNLDSSFDMGNVFAKKIKKEIGIHLCHDCYKALHLISEGAKMPEQPSSKVIKVRYLSDEIEKLEYIGGKSDWIDLRAAEDVMMTKGEFTLIPLGVAIQLPSGYEAHIIPRSSTYKNFGIIQANHMGLIDESYCVHDDQWYFPAIAMRDTIIHINDRVCQFRIAEHQPELTFEIVDTLGNENRGGLGSTGVR